MYGSLSTIFDLYININWVWRILLILVQVYCVLLSEWPFIWYCLAYFSLFLGLILLLSYIYFLLIWGITSAYFDHITSNYFDRILYHYDQPPMFNLTPPPSLRLVCHPPPSLRLVFVKHESTFMESNNERSPQKLIIAGSVVSRPEPLATFTTNFYDFYIAIVK